MASQIPADNCDCYEVPSFIQGYHAYQDLWNLSVGQVLRLRKEPDNSHDSHAVAVVKSGNTVVGHVPYNLAYSHISWQENSTKHLRYWEKTTRGAGYGLKVPCIYRLYSPNTLKNREYQYTPPKV